MATSENTAGQSDKLRLWMILALIVAVLGIAISGYATYHHLQVKASGQTDAACNINDQFSCDAVALSEYSEVAGIPLGVLGLGYFFAMAVLAFIGLRGSKGAREHIHSYALMVIIGVAVSVGLAAISYFKLSAFCPSCMVVYALTLAQFVMLVVYRREIPAGMTVGTLGSGASTAGIAVAVVIIGFSLFKPKTVGPEVTESSVTSNDNEAPALSSKVEDIPIAKSAYAGLGEDYRKGNDNAKIVLVEFADFQCPACGSLAGTLRELATEYGNQVLIVFRNYPLDQTCNSSMRSKMHEHACQAAVLARCAGQYGKFWEYHDLVFNNQREISAGTLRTWGQQVGMTAEQMDACIASPDILAKVKDDIALGNKLGVDSTPTLFMNGRKVIGRGLDDLRRQIDQQLD